MSLKIAGSVMLAFKIWVHHEAAIEACPMTGQWSLSVLLGLKRVQWDGLCCLLKDTTVIGF